MKKLTALLLLLMLVAFSAHAAAKATTTPTGLKYNDEKIGTGAEAVKGKTVVVHYTGWLN